MKNRKMPRIVGLMLIAALLVAGCSKEGGVQGVEAPRSIQVAVSQEGSSCRYVLPEVKGSVDWEVGLSDRPNAANVDGELGVLYTTPDVTGTCPYVEWIVMGVGLEGGAVSVASYMKCEEISRAGGGQRIESCGN